MTQINLAQLIGQKSQGGESNPSTLISESSEERGTDALAFDIALLQVMQPHSVMLSTPPVWEQQADEASYVPLAHETEMGTETEMTDEPNQQLLDALLQGGAAYSLTAAPLNAATATPLNAATAAPLIPVMRTTAPLSDAKQTNAVLINEMTTPSLLAERVTPDNSAPSVERFTSDLALNSLVTNRTAALEMPTVASPPGLNTSPAAHAEQSLKTADIQLTLQGHREQWSQQLRTALGERLQLQIDNRIQQATIRLDPPDMGKIDITVNFDAGKLHVHINANQGDIYRALQLSSHELRQNLTGLNAAQVDVQISSNSQQQQRRDQEMYSEPDIIAAQLINKDEELNADDGTLLITV